eukprot:Ihof_evm6s148 gene=Ihof_evmTU6s148
MLILTVSALALLATSCVADGQSRYRIDGNAKCGATCEPYCDETNCEASATANCFAYNKWMSTKTPYWAQEDSSDWTPVPETCNPILLEGVFRHGARNPGGSDIKKMKNLRKLLKDNKHLVEKSANPWAADWEVIYEKSEAHLLIPEGAKELYDIAQRYRAAFPDLFKESFNAIKYNFSSTQISRALQSGSAFTYGLFERKETVGINLSYQPVSIWSASLDVDYLLRFFDTCPNYVNSIMTIVEGKEVKKPLTEQIKFKNGPLMTELRKEVSKKLGLPEDIVSLDDISGMYRACSYDSIVEHDTSKWCYLLGERGMQIMDYHDDLKQWWIKGPGAKINYEISCSLLADMFKHIDDRLACKTELNANIRFAHAETVLPLLTLLNLFDNDQKLYANTTYEVFSKRSWRSNFLSPFAANVMFAFYDCAA